MLLLLLLLLLLLRQLLWRQRLPSAAIHGLRERRLRVLREKFRLLLLLRRHRRGRILLWLLLGLLGRRGIHPLPLLLLPLLLLPLLLLPLRLRWRQWHRRRGHLHNLHRNPPRGRLLLRPPRHGQHHHLLRLWLPAAAIGGIQGRARRRPAQLPRRPGRRSHHYIRWRRWRRCCCWCCRRYWWGLERLWWLLWWLVPAA
jgi:hypothetical protein